MEIDIRTIIIILNISHLMQMLIFFYQYKVNKVYKGISWWFAWSAVESVGFVFVLLRDIPSIFPIVVIMQNTLIILGTLFIYIGVMRFFEKKENLIIIIPGFCLYLLALLYFLFIDNDIQKRSVVVNLVLALISFLTAISLYKNNTPSIKTTVNFNTSIFVLHGCFFIYRSIMILRGTPVDDMFIPTLFNIILFFDALIVSLLWTFGLIIMVNQRLNSEMTEAKEHFEQIFSTSPDAAIITRLSDGLIINFNDGYNQISGFSKEDIFGKTSLEINIWQNPEDRKEVIRRIKEYGICENYEAKFRKKDGTEIIGLMSAKLMSLKGIPHIISITRDLTERKKSEQLLKSSEKNSEHYLKIWQRG